MNEQRVIVRGYPIHVEINGDPVLPTLVFLHGFTGSTETWNDMVPLLQGKFQTIAIDLTGHGKSSIPEQVARYSMKEQVEDLEALFEQLGLERFVLVGYSMGGRIALAYTAHHPKRVASLILESASPGLRTEAERAERRKVDQKLAERILTEGVTSFVGFWEEIPLFATQKALPEEKRLAIRQERLGQSRVGLANSLLGMGTGSQPSYWKELSSIQIKVLLITGEIDSKFVFIAREMKKILPRADHYSVEQAGHAIHVEKPIIFATMIEEHLKKLEIEGGNI